MKRKIVFVVTSPYAVNAFLRSHLLVLAEKYHVTVLVNSSIYPLLTDIDRAVRVEHINIVRKVSLMQDALTLWHLIVRFRVIKPAVVHSITPKAGILAMLAARMAGVPLRFHTFTGQVWSNKKGCSRFLLKLVDRLMTIFSSQVLADSVSQARFLEREKVVREGDVLVLGQGSVAGVDLSQFRPDPNLRSTFRYELEISDEKLVFLFVGRLVPDKGVIDLINAFCVVSSQYSNCELWVVGPDETGLQAELESRANNVNARIRWFGPTFNPEKFMRAADILVLPSYREGFGAVIIEAAACGAPSIAYRIDGVVDAINDNKTGLLVDKGDIVALSKAMLLVASNPSLRAALSENAYQRVISQFSSSVLTTCWLRFYSKAIETIHVP